MQRYNCVGLQKVSEYDQEIPQSHINPRHREEEPQNTNSQKKSLRRLKQSNKNSLFLVKIIANLERTQRNA